MHYSIFTCKTRAATNMLKLYPAAIGIKPVDMLDNIPETKNVYRAPYFVQSQLNGNVEIMLAIETAQCKTVF